MIGVGNKLVVESMQTIDAGLFTELTLEQQFIQSIEMSSKFIDQVTIMKAFVKEIFKLILSQVMIMIMTTE